MLNIRLAIRFIFNLKKSSYSSYASWLTIIGLSIGVAALMLTTSIISGFKDVVSDKLSILEGQGRLKHFLNKPVLLDHDLLKSFFNNSNYKINPYVTGACMIRKGKNLDGVIIEGIIEYPNLTNSKDLNHIENNQIILGESLYEATSIICKKPLATKVPANKAAGIFNLSKIKIKIIETKINNKSSMIF